VLHSIQEGFLKGTRPLGADEYETMWSPARKHLPAFGSAVDTSTGVYAELELSGEIRGHYFKMFADVAVVHDSHVVIKDLKSSTDPKKHMLTMQQMRSDPQVILYCLAAMDKFGVDRAVAEWVYIRTWKKGSKYPKKPKSLTVRVEFGYGEALLAYGEHVANTAIAIEDEYEAERAGKRRLPLRGVGYTHPMGARSCPCARTCHHRNSSWQH
jgi:hypothetical protein